MGKVKRVASPGRNEHSGTKAGVVRVFRFDESGENWVQMGKSVTGEMASEKTGSSLSLSTDVAVDAVLEINDKPR